MSTKTAALDGFHDIQALAVTKAIATKIAKVARENIEPGEYDVSFDCHIEGTIRVGQDYQTTSPNKAQPWNIVVALMTELETTRQAAGMGGLDIDKLVAMAETVDPTLVKNAKAKAEEAAAAIKDATLTQAKGKVTATLDITPLDMRD